MQARDLQKFRQLADMSQAALARRLDITVRTVQRWEAGEVEIPKAIELAIRTIKAEDGLRISA